MVAADNLFNDAFSSPTTVFDVYTPIKSYAGAIVQPDVVKSFIVPDKPQIAFSDKITISTTVYDEFGDPLPGANIHIDGKPIASTSASGSVTIPGIATSVSIVKVTYVGMQDYSISAVFVPKQIRMKPSITQLNEVVITIPKKVPVVAVATTPTTTPTTKDTAEPSKTNWLLWLTIAGLGYKAYQRFGPKSTTVKAKI